MDARAANDRIAERARQLRFISRVPMLCECDSPDCRTLVMISLDDYDELSGDPHRILTALGHEVAGAELETETPGYAVRRMSRRVREGNGCRG